jgi:hypothetical protein
MTMRIETALEGPTVTFRLIGRIQSEHLDHLTTHMRTCQRTIVLDLDEVTLVDVQVVRFLGAAERAGVGLRNCPPFIREWISRERDE